MTHRRDGSRLFDVLLYDFPMPDRYGLRGTACITLVEEEREGGSFGGCFEGEFYGVCSFVLV